MKKVICSEHAPAAIGPYAQAIAANGIVFTSGQLPIDPATGAFPEGIAAQTKQSLTNVKAILAEAGTGMDQVIKTTVFLSDMNNFGAMNEVYATFFGEGSYPARSAVEVARLPKDALVEIEVIAVSCRKANQKAKLKRNKERCCPLSKAGTGKFGFDDRGTSKTKRHNWR